MSRRRFAPLFFGAFVLAVVVLVALGLRDEAPEERRLAPGRGATEEFRDPLAWHEDRRQELEERAAAGLAHVLYAKSPGGVVRTAQRVDRFRELVEAAAERGDVDADMLEALVFLESAGRPRARASNDVEAAAGLTQILAETGRNLLRMRIDARSPRGRKRVDDRFDPRKALAATVRYLDFARSRLERDDLAFVSYHMGVGNLERALAAYGEDEIPYAQLFFDSTPLRHDAAWRILSSLGDDSSTYLWRLLAAKEIMRLYREDPEELGRRALAHAAKASAEDALHPPEKTQRYPDPIALGQARAAGDLAALDARLLADNGLRRHPRMGELAARLNQSPRLYYALRPEALALAVYLGSGVREIARTEPLTITSAIRDQRYQDALVSRNREATRAYSLHTTGWAFDVSRRYRNRAQALAFQFWLDRLQALDLIAWAREPGAIHITVSERAEELLGLLPDG